MKVISISNIKGGVAKTTTAATLAAGLNKRGYKVLMIDSDGPEWDPNIPTKGKEAEAGCIGCPWYDIERWRKEVIKKLEEEQ